MERPLASHRISRVVDDLAWQRADRHGISDYERRRCRELLASDERLLLDARGRDDDGPVLWLVTARRLIMVTHECFDEDVRDIRLTRIMHVDSQRDWRGWTVHVMGDARRASLGGLDGERAQALHALLRTRAGLCHD
jgi:hypothetical protein